MREKTLICAQCGLRNAPDAKFCRKCGNELDYVCLNCGRQLSPGAKFCGSCGKQIGARPYTASEHDSRQPEEDTESHTIVWKVLAGAAVIVVALIVVWSQLDQRQHSPEKEVRQSVSSSNRQDNTNSASSDVSSQRHRGGTVKDIDGNVYKTIQIGNQWWMAENLKVTHYRNGDPIPHVKDADMWRTTKDGAYCSYDNDARHSSAFGKLYNWYSVVDRRNIAPDGWHVPTEDEWQTLIDFLGGEDVACGKLKEAGYSHWKRPNSEATNSSGFTALPGGYRYTAGGFKEMGNGAYFWSSTEFFSHPGGYEDRVAQTLSTHYDFENNKHNWKGLATNVMLVSFGLSVRCVKGDVARVSSGPKERVSSQKEVTRQPTSTKPSNTRKRNIDSRTKQLVRALYAGKVSFTEIEEDLDGFTQDQWLKLVADVPLSEWVRTSLDWECYPFDEYLSDVVFRQSNSRVSFETPSNEYGTPVKWSGTYRDGILDVSARFCEPPSDGIWSCWDMQLFGQVVEGGDIAGRLTVVTTYPSDENDTGDTDECFFRITQYNRR